ncbi:MAG TPA: aldo/keto reductase [Arachidicoccus sp.]|nr:aldo/keto reductase [Arachidicoccus sp.]
MEKITIGQTDLKVGRINLGGNVFGWTLDEAASFEILDAFVGRGYNFIDTADVYSVWGGPNNKGGESETIIGKWMKARGNRDQIILATKVGWDFKDGRKGLKASYIHQAAADSLRRLQTDYIDLYYNHIDTGEVPLEESLGAFQDLVKSGKVRYMAASNVPADRLKRSLEMAKSGDFPRYHALQPHYNLVERKKYESNYADLVNEYALTVFPYWSLAAGFLTGKYRFEGDLGKSTRGGDAKKYLTPEGLGVLDALDKVAAKHGSAPASVALAWLLNQPGIGAPIASATKLAQLETLFAAPELAKVLDKEDLALLDQRSQSFA